MLTNTQYDHFVTTNSQGLFRYIFYIVGSRFDAEDILQDLLMKIWNRRAKIEIDRNLEGLAYRMAKNACMDYFRTLKKRESDVLEIENNEVSTAEDGQSRLEQQESWDILLSIIRALPEIQRDVIILRNLEGYSMDKIAEITQLKLNTVEVYLSRARKTVRAAYLKIERNETKRTN